MAFGFSKTRFSPIAIDFGADSLKLLQIGLGGAPELIAAVAQTLPESARGETAGRLAFLERVIKERFQTPVFRGRRVMCSIPAFQTLVHHLEIPGPDEGGNLETEIGRQLHERLGLDPSRMVVRSFQVGQVVRDGSTRHRVICLAAKRETIMGYIELLRRCKLEVVGMHSEPLCLMRAFAHLYRRESDQQRTTCFLDIGAATTKLVIAHGREMVFAKDIHAGGDAITQRVALAARMSFAEARQSRITGGDDGPLTAMLDADFAGVLAADEEDKAGEETVECLTDELKLCLRYYRSLYGDRAVEKLVFVGGEAHNQGLCKRIAQAVGLPAQLGDPLARMAPPERADAIDGLDLSQPQPGWAVPVGLCLSEANL